MTRPRSALVSLTDTPWYHVVNRCVRRAFLCGQDAATGQNFDHRRGWIETRIRELASVFTIDVAAYAVMSNHYHVVLRVDSARACALDDEAVLRRWTQLFTGPLLVQRYLSELRGQMGPAELDKVHEFAELYRQRLFDLSWFMRVLNESIARLDDLQGQPFVPVLAPVVGPEAAQPAPQAINDNALQPIQNMPSLLPEVELSTLPEAPLMPFDPTSRFEQAIPFGLQEYLELVDTMGHAVHPSKRGFIPATNPPILTRLGLDAGAFINAADHFFKDFAGAVGTPAKLIEIAAGRQQRALRGLAAAKRVFMAKAA